jgi:pilus assembly protein CpaD
MNNRLLNRKNRIAGVIALALLAAGCSADATNWSPAASPKANKVELVHLTHDIAFFGTEAEADGVARGSLESFLARHEVGYGDRIYVIAAPRDPGPVAVARAENVARLLARRGLQPTVLPHAEWAGQPASRNALRVLVHRFVVRSPACPDFRKPGAADYGNTESSNFGCANAVNLGLMVADPRDLVEGRDSGHSDGERAAAATRRYREGKELPLDKSGTSSASGTNAK